MIDDYAGMRVTVMGLGRFGGGVGVTRFLAERGADVLVTDTLPPEELETSVAQLADLEAKGAVSYRLGEHNVSDFTTCDLLVVNPAVPPGNRFVRAARAAGVPITSEIRLLVKHLPNRLRTIGVTGSAGKSTTTAMIAHILRKVLGQEGETPRRQDAKTSRTKPGVWVGGNIGGSLLPRVEEIQPDDWVVLELSSFMLEGLREDQWSPHIAVVTNITPNHLDWHGSMENYVAAKQVIADFQREQDGDVLISGERDNRAIKPRPRVSRCITIDDSDEGSIWRQLSSQSFELSTPGTHNITNAVTAAIAVIATSEDSSFEEFSVHLKDFSGLPHRLEYVGEFGLVKAYNDSKSTTPEATATAVSAFDAETVRIIMGGYDKGSDFQGVAGLLAKWCAGVYTIGATEEVIAEAVETQRDTTWAKVCPPGCVVVRCEKLEVAVKQALDDAKPGEVLVLSPGCASWDQFANYEERGVRFVELVKQHGATS